MSSLLKPSHTHTQNTTASLCDSHSRFNTAVSCPHSFVVKCAVLGVNYLQQLELMELLRVVTELVNVVVFFLSYDVIRLISTALHFAAGSVPMFRLASETCRGY